MNSENVTGMIFNIQRFSIHDGPGIRTTVFLKGCNMRCLWCHNPESHSFEPQLMFYKHKCVGCGACEAVCSKAFDFPCEACGRCVAVCRHGAREITGRTITAADCLEEIKKDMDFYMVSGGGVTFSGGEPMLQHAFLMKLLKLCKENQIHTAIETAGNVEWKYFEEALPHIDCILYDLKAMDDKKHREFTGVSNALILDNAERLMNCAPKKMFFRMPFIPGYNDAEYEKIVEFVRGFPLELMPYHSYGEGKYEALNREYKLKV